MEKKKRVPVFGGVKCSKFSEFKFFEILRISGKSAEIQLFHVFKKPPSADRSPKCSLFRVFFSKTCFFVKNLMFDPRSSVCF